VKINTRLVASLAVAIAMTMMSAGLGAQTGTNNGEWRTHGGDLGSTRYAPLDQINAQNFSKLQVAWRFKTDILGARPDFNLQTTPLMIIREMPVSRSCGGHELES